MPVEQPTKFSLAVNLGTARRFGMAMPKNFVVRADEILD